MPVSIRFQSTRLPDQNEQLEPSFTEATNTIAKMHLTKIMLELFKVKTYNIEIHERNEN